MTGKTFPDALAAYEVCRARRQTERIIYISGQLLFNSAKGTFKQCRKDSSSDMTAKYQIFLKVFLGNPIVLAEQAFG